MPRALTKTFFALAAQGISSLSNVVIFVIVARQLGPQGLGEFSICFTLMLLLVSIQTAWVGDAYTVLDRESSNVLAGVQATQLLHLAAAPLVAISVAHFAFGIGLIAALCLGALVIGWELEEYGRRVLMAHQRFVHQGLSDSVYLVVATTLMLSLSQVFDFTLTMALAAASVACLLAFIFNQIVCGREGRLHIVAVKRPDLSLVAQFGLWRAAQSGAGYFSQIAVRYAVVLIGSVAALGNLEAARLIAAPLFTVLAAGTNVMLPMFVSMRGAEPLLFIRRLRLATIACVFSVAVYSSIALVLADELTEFLVGPGFEPDLLMIGGWCLLGLSMAASLPATSAASAVLPSRQLFHYRITGVSIGLISSVGLAYVLGVGWVPVGQAIGFALSGAFILRAATRHYMSPVNDVARL